MSGTRRRKPRPPRAAAESAGSASDRPARKVRKARRPARLARGQHADPARDGSARERLVRATEALLTERGIDGVSMADVARAAGLDKSLIFYYFGTKADLIETVLDEYYAAHTRALAAAFEVEGTFRERIHRVMDAYFEFIDGHRLYPRLVQQEIGRCDVDTGKIRQSLAGLCRWTERALEGVVPPDGPRSAKHLFVSLAGVVINYFTYAPVLDELWGDDPLGDVARAERRAHVHWLVDALLAALPGVPPS